MNDSLFTDKDLDQEEIEKERKSAENKTIQNFVLRHIPPF